MKHRSISERLARAGTLSVRREIAHDWQANWMQDHDAEIQAIERALQRGHIQEAGQALGRLKALSDKRFTAMPRVIEALSDDDIA